MQSLFNLNKVHYIDLPDVNNVLGLSMVWILTLKFGGRYVESLESLYQILNPTFL